MYTIAYIVYVVVGLGDSRVISARVSKERIELVEAIARAEKVDRSTVLDRALEHYTQEWRLQKALKSYMEGHVTLSRAAEVAGLSIWEMIDVIDKRRISPQYDIEDLEDDLKALRNERR